MPWFRFRTLDEVGGSSTTPTSSAATGRRRATSCVRRTRLRALRPRRVLHDVRDRQRALAADDREVRRALRRPPRGGVTTALGAAVGGGHRSAPLLDHARRVRESDARPSRSTSSGDAPSKRETGSMEPHVPPVYHDRTDPSSTASTGRGVGSAPVVQPSTASVSAPPVGSATSNDALPHRQVLSASGRTTDPSSLIRPEMTCSQFVQISIRRSVILSGCAPARVRRGVASAEIDGAALLRFAQASSR